MIGIPIPITAISPIAVVNQLKRKGNCNASFNSKATMYMLNVKTSVFTISNNHVFLIYRARKMMIPSDSAECATPKKRSYKPNGENKFVMNTPNTIPKKYFLLNTTR